MLEVLLALGAVVGFVLGLPALVVVFSYIANGLWSLLCFLGNGVLSVWDLTAGKTDDGLKRLFNGKPEPKKPKVEPNYNRIKDLEEWEKYYRMGCYDEGDCRHVIEQDESLKQNSEKKHQRAERLATHELGLVRRGVSEVATKTDLVAYGDEIMLKELRQYFKSRLSEGVARPSPPYCQRLDNMFRSPQFGLQFDELKPWLKDIDNMLEVNFDASPESE